MSARLRLVPGSVEDMDQYLKARAIDELLTEIDTVGKQAATARANRANA